MWRKFWLSLLFLTSCLRRSETPPIAPDTLKQVLKELYAYRAALLHQPIPPAVADSLLALYTHQVLSKYHLDTARWSATRTYYLSRPGKAVELLEELLREGP
ncbi:MAG: DUF4296 domain-containing protein [Bacteroidia bacterium]